LQKQEKERGGQFVEFHRLRDGDAPENFKEKVGKGQNHEEAVKTRELWGF